MSSQPPDLRALRGKAGEAVALAHLRSRGYLIERTNVRFPVGEIDIVAWESGTLCFIEVRSRSSHAWGTPSESVTFAKRQRLLRAAQWYMARCRTPVTEVRFDVVALTWQEAGAPSIELIRAAFTADEA